MDGPFGTAHFTVPVTVKDTERPGKPHLLDRRSSPNGRKVARGCGDRRFFRGVAR
jgi:hypothetical protein